MEETAQTKDNDRRHRHKTTAQDKEEYKGFTPSRNEKQ
jgi:hypothetical protein